MTGLRRSGLAAAIAASLAAVAGSACDGGPIGTGISGLSGARGIAGSVAAVPGVPLGASSREASATIASLPDGGIVVSVEGRPGASAPVAADGSFAISGAFAGRVVVRFDAPDRVVRAAIDSPAGGLVLLPDTVLARSGALFDGGRILNLEGRIASVDCESGSLSVEPVAGESRDVRSIAIDGDTRIFGPDGAATDCAAIRPGSRLLVDGRFDPADGTGWIEALSISLDRGVPDEPAVPDTDFAGWIVARDCRRGLLSLADSKRRAWVAIAPLTVVRDDAGDDVACAGLAIGDRARGTGRLVLGAPDVVEADSISVSRSREGAIEVRLAGRVVEVDCSQARLAVSAHGVRSALRIGVDTEFPEGVACEDVPVGAWLRGLGRIDLARPDRSIDALRLSLWSPGLDSEPAIVD